MRQRSETHPQTPQDREHCGHFLQLARWRAIVAFDNTFDIGRPAVFCDAQRRSLYAEQTEIGKQNRNRSILRQSIEIRTSQTLRSQEYGSNPRAISGASRGQRRRISSQALEYGAMVVRPLTYLAGHDRVAA